jgi:hypothetical protein
MFRKIRPQASKVKIYEKLPGISHVFPYRQTDEDKVGNYEVESRFA